MAAAAAATEACNSYARGVRRFWALVVRDSNAIKSDQIGLDPIRLARIESARRGVAISLLLSFSLSRASGAAQAARTRTRTGSWATLAAHRERERERETKSLRARERVERQWSAMGAPLVRAKNEKKSLRSNLISAGDDCRRVARGAICKRRLATFATCATRSLARSLWPHTANGRKRTQTDATKRLHK